MKRADAYLSDWLRAYSEQVARQPLPFLLVPLLVTVVLSSGIWLRFEHIQDADYLFAARDAAYKRERQTITNYWANSDQNFHPAKDSGMLQRKGAYVLVSAKDGGSVLRPSHANEFLQWMQYAHHNITFPAGKHTFSYEQVCLRWRQGACFTNPHASFIADLFRNNEQGVFAVTYPRWRSPTQNVDVFLGDTLGGVRLNGSRLLAAQAWLLMYPLKSDASAEELSAEWENALGAAIEDEQREGRGFFSVNRLLRYSHFHSQTLQQELDKDAEVVQPRFTLAFIVLLVFSVLCTVSWRRHEAGWPLVDWCLSKPLLSLMALVSAVLAVLSARGALLHLGVPHADIVNVMPFIAVSIGVDDMFLMLAAWRNAHGHNDVVGRLGESMSHAAVSITITSVTDGLSFAVGTLAPLPAVTIFCTYAALAVSFFSSMRFVYTLTFFLAVFVYTARWEAAGRHCCLPWLKTVTPAEAHGWQLVLASGSQPTTRVAGSSGSGSPAPPPSLTSAVSTAPPSPIDSVGSHKGVDSCSSCSLPSAVDSHHPSSSTGLSHFFEHVYAPLICHPLVSCGSLLLLLAYLIVGLSAAQHVRIGFELKNLLFRGSSAYEFTEQRERLFAGNINRVDIVVQRPPELWRPDERDAFIEVVRAFESTAYSAGRQSTQLWLFAFVDYLRQIVPVGPLAINTQQTFFLHLREFIKINEYYAYDIRLSASATDIDVFRFSIGLDNIHTNTDKVHAATAVRSICVSNGQYNLSSFSMLYPLADQFSLMLPQTVQNVGIALVCVVLVSLLLIPVPLCALVVALTVVSIDIGVVGYMTLSVFCIWFNWGVNLDCISMITLAMSVGFSVDFAAHITYGYTTIADQQQRLATPAERVAASLGHLGVPLLQAACTTVLGVSVLITVDTYIVQTCVKTVVLVIVFGTAHALLFLPVALLSCHCLWLHVLRPATQLCLAQTGIVTSVQPESTNQVAWASHANVAKRHSHATSRTQSRCSSCGAPTTTTTTSTATDYK